MEAPLSLADEDTGIELLYRNKPLDNIPFKGVEFFNKFCSELGIKALQTETNWSTEYSIPDHYKNIDVLEYTVDRLYDKLGDEAPNSDQLHRIAEELREFDARNLFPVLQLMIYIVDTMRENNLVWGAGRGSSVSSYVLYLLGVHKVDSLKYKLDIKEFLK